MLFIELTVGIDYLMDALKQVEGLVLSDMYTTTTLIYNVLHLPTVGVNYSKNGFKESGWSTKTHQFLLKI